MSRMYKGLLTIASPRSNPHVFRTASNQNNSPDEELKPSMARAPKMKPKKSNKITSPLKQNEVYRGEELNYEVVR
jgi:hypothetical protein